MGHSDAAPYDVQSGNKTPHGDTTMNEIIAPAIIVVSFIVLSAYYLRG
jgi:hypothetical protein